MSASFAQQEAIKLRRIERQERQRQKEHDRETKLAHAAGMTLMQWWIQRDNLRKVEVVKDAIESAKRDPELRAALLRELGCSCITQKALPAPS